MLAAWGPEDEVAFLALPARAAAGSAASPTARTPSATRTPSGSPRCSARPPSTSVRTTLHVDSLDALWDGIRGGTVRTAARLERAHPRNATAPARAHPLAEPYRVATGYELPVTILIART